MKKIGFLGLKGMPPRFGGLQFDAEEIGVHLVKKGYDVIVYCRKWYQNNYHYDSYKGMKLKVIKTPTFSLFIEVAYHLLSSCYYAYKDKIDVLYFFGTPSYFAVLFFKFLKIKTIIRRNGCALKTTSYNLFGRLYLEFLILLGIKYANIITTEMIIEKKHAEKHTKKKIFITPVGVVERNRLEPDLIKKNFSLDFNNYILFIGRFVRVKRIEWLINSFFGENARNRIIKDFSIDRFTNRDKCTKELIINGEDGFLAEKGNINDWICKCNQILNNLDSRIKFENNEFSNESVKCKMDKVFLKWIK